MSIDLEQPLPTAAQHSPPSSITMTAITPSIASMSTVFELKPDYPQSLQRSSDYNISPQDPEPEADEQVLEALRSPKDRLFVLKLGESMESLIQDRHNRTKIELVPSSSYHKLLVHRCAVYYRLTPVTEAGKRSVMLVVMPESRIPLRRIADLVPVDDSPFRPFQIMRRVTHTARSKASSQTGSGNDDSAIGTGDVSDGDMSEAGSVRGSKKKTLTLSERQAQYEEARSRIFKDLEEKEKQKSQDMSASSSTFSLLSVDSSSVGAASGGGSSSVGESPDDSGSVDRDRDWDSSSKDKNDIQYTASVTSGTARSSRPHNTVFNCSGHPSSYRPTLYDPSAPSGPNLPPPQNNYPHYQSPVYPVYSYGPPSFMPPYVYPFPYPPPPPPNDASGGTVPMNSVPPTPSNESSTSSPSDMYAVPPVSYVNPYVWSQSPHAHPNIHSSPQAPPPPEYGQNPFNSPPPNHPIHPHVYGGHMPVYVSHVPPVQAHSQSPHQQPCMHVPLQPSLQSPMHPPPHTYQPQPQHPQQLFQPPHPLPRASLASSSQPQMPPPSMRSHSLGSSPEGYIHSPNPMIAPNHANTHTNGTKSQPHPAGYEHYMTAPHLPNMWMPPHAYPYPQQPSNNLFPPRRPSGKSLYNPVAEGDNSQDNLVSRFPYRRNGGRSGPPSNVNITNNQGIGAGFSGEMFSAAQKKLVQVPPNANSQTSPPMKSTSGSSSSISTTSSTSQSSANSSKQAIPTSKHPLPARPDWAVGLKAQPTLHHSQNYPVNLTQRNYHKLPVTSDGVTQVDLPALQSMDFPPLPLNVNSNATNNNNIVSTAFHRPILGGAWATHPTNKVFLGSTSNVLPSAEGSLPGPASMDTKGLTTGGGASLAASSIEPNGVPSRLDEPDRAFERPGLKVGCELFNPHVALSKGNGNAINYGHRNHKLKGSSYGKNKAQGGGSNDHSAVLSSIGNGASSDSIAKNDMTVGILTDHIGDLYVNDGKENSNIDERSHSCQRRDDLGSN